MLIDFNLSSEFTRSDGRKFAFPVGLAFLALAAVLLWRESETVWKVFTGLGTALILAGLIIPARLGPIYRAWMRFAFALSRITTPIFMGIVYFGIILVTGVLRRNVGKSPILREPGQESFWVARDRTRGNLERQF